MGSCISKCKLKKKVNDRETIPVHDKLVISQEPIASIPETTVIPSDKPLFPTPSSTSSFSSFSDSKCTITSSISSSSSTCSSVLYAKDHSFSEEFLRACVKENPQIVNPMIKQIIPSANPNKVKFKPYIHETSTINVPPTPKKRARANSPTLVRQKSFRSDHNSSSLVLNRGLRSPSPSRRFNSSENNRSFLTNANDRESSCSRRMSVSKGISGNQALPRVKRESFRAHSTLSPSVDSTMITRNISAAKKESLISSHKVSAKVDGFGVGEFKCSQEMDTVMEDVNNPLIALDCFIFL